MIKAVLITFFIVVIFFSPVNASEYIGTLTIGDSGAQNFAGIVEETAPPINPSTTSPSASSTPPSSNSSRGRSSRTYTQPAIVTTVQSNTSDTALTTAPISKETIEDEKSPVELIIMPLQETQLEPVSAPASTLSQAFWGGIGGLMGLLTALGGAILAIKLGKRV